MSNRKISSELFSSPLNINIEWSDSFIEWLRVNETTEPKTLKQMQQMLTDLFSLTLNNSKKPFNLFTFEDLKAYTTMLEDFNYSQKTIDRHISWISSFKDYLISQYSESFPSNFLSDYDKLRKPSKTIPKGQPFDLVQLSHIRKYRDHDPKSEYCFELFFQLGIDKKDVAYCSPQNLDRQRWVFKRPDGTVIPINNGLIEIIKDTEDIDNLTISYEMVNNYFRNIATYLKSNNQYSRNRNITLYDIEKTRERFFHHCPNCNLIFETFSDNWVLAKADIDNKYHLVCNVCKGKPQNED